MEYDIEIIEENVTNEEQNNDVVLADYYDNYYDKVLANMNTISTNQETIIKNQEEIITQNTTRNLFSGTILFMICLFFIYYFLRKMIIVK